MILTTLGLIWRRRLRFGVAALVVMPGLMGVCAASAQNATVPVQPPVPAPSATATVAPTVPTAATPAASAPAPLRSGTFKSAEGDVVLIRGATRIQLAPGAALDVGDRIVTGETGSAVVTLRDATVLTIGPNSVVDLSRFGFEPTTQRGEFLVNLLEGTVRVVTGLLGRINPDLFKVHTPTSVVGVRGTDFIVEAAPNPTVRKALP